MERPGRFDVGIESDGHHGKASRFEFDVQRLPPGQVETASSPRRPRQKEHFAAPQVGDINGVAPEVGQHDLGKDDIVEHPPACSGPQG